MVWYRLAAIRLMLALFQVVGYFLAKAPLAGPRVDDEAQAPLSDPAPGRPEGEDNEPTGATSALELTAKMPTLLKPILSVAVGYAVARASAGRSSAMRNGPNGYGRQLNLTRVVYESS